MIFTFWENSVIDIMFICRRRTPELAILAKLKNPSPLLDNKTNDVVSGISWGSLLDWPKMTTKTIASLWNYKFKFKNCLY